MEFAPLKVLTSAIRAVPAVRYALGVAGVVSVIAIVQALHVDVRIAAWGTIVMFILMSMLVIFARLAAAAPREFFAPVLVFTWFSLVLTMATALLMFTSVFFQRPIDLRYWLPGTSTLQSATPRTEKPPEIPSSESKTGPASTIQPTARQERQRETTNSTADTGQALRQTPTKPAYVTKGPSRADLSWLVGEWEANTTHGKIFDDDAHRCWNATEMHWTLSLALRAPLTGNLDGVEPASQSTCVDGSTYTSGGWSWHLDVAVQVGTANAPEMSWKELEPCGGGSCTSGASAIQRVTEKEFTIIFSRYTHETLRFKKR